MHNSHIPSAAFHDQNESEKHQHTSQKSPATIRYVTIAKIVSTRIIPSIPLLFIPRFSIFAKEIFISRSSCLFTITLGIIRNSIWRIWEFFLIFTIITSCYCLHMLACLVLSLQREYLILLYETVLNIPPYNPNYI